MMSERSRYFQSNIIPFPCIPIDDVIPLQRILDYSDLDYNHRHNIVCGIGKPAMAVAKHGKIVQCFMFNRILSIHKH